MRPYILLMLSTITVLLVITLSIQVLPVALGIDNRIRISRIVLFGLILVVIQVLFFWLGYVLGERFMHLLENYRSTVIFAGFFLIGIRMVMDAFKVRSGERTFIIDKPETLALSASAQGINTLLAGLLFTFLVTDSSRLLVVLFVASVLVSIIGIALKPAKTSLALASFLYFAGGVWMIVAATILAFFRS